MRIIPAEALINAVAQAFVDINYVLPGDVLAALRRVREAETSPVGRQALDQIIANAGIARQGRFPLCQDTGLPVLFVELGEDARVEGGLRNALQEAIRQGTAKGYLRRTVCDPFTRRNTGDNTPAVIHLDLVPGDRLVIDLLAKGGGAENMSRAVVLTPAAGPDGVVALAVETVRGGAVNACPPITVGIGVGGDLEVAAILAKKALTRPLGQPSADPQLAELEARALDRINRLGIGPGGLGGRTTALAVHAAAAPCHIASLPVAVVLQCHAHRSKRITL